MTCPSERRHNRRRTQRKFVRGKSRRVNGTSNAVRAHTAPLSVVRSARRTYGTSAGGRPHPRLPSLGIPSIVHTGSRCSCRRRRLRPRRRKPHRRTRARAIEAFSNFRSVEAPGWTGGIRFQRRRPRWRTRSAQWKPLLTTTCACQLSLPRGIVNASAAGGMIFCPRQVEFGGHVRFLLRRNGALIFSFLYRLSSCRVSKRRPVAHYHGFRSALLHCANRQLENQPAIAVTTTPVTWKASYK